MSLVLQSSGGGSVTIAEPTTASNFTQTLPAADGVTMVSGNMPAFSAYSTISQTLTSGISTKITCNVEEFDTNSFYDNTTNYRFTPTVAGYYQVSAGLRALSSGLNRPQIFKNGSAWKWGSESSSASSSMSCLVYLNGSTDYIEFYGTFAPGATTDVASSFYTYFQAVMVRAA